MLHFIWASMSYYTWDPRSPWKEIRWTFLELDLKGEIDEYLLPFKNLLKYSIFSLLTVDTFLPKQLSFPSIFIVKKRKTFIKNYFHTHKWSISECNKWGLKSISDKKFLAQLSSSAKIKCLQQDTEVDDKGSFRAWCFDRMHETSHGIHGWFCCHSNNHNHND